MPTTSDGLPIELLRPSPAEFLLLLALTLGIAGGVMLWPDSGCACIPRLKAAEHEVANLVASVEIYKVMRSECPQSIEDLRAAGIIARVRKDPWGNDYVLSCIRVNAPVDVVSAGKDGRFGTEDDVHAWDPDPMPERPAR